MTVAETASREQFKVHLYEDFTGGKRGTSCRFLPLRDTVSIFAQVFSVSDSRRFVAEPLAGSDFVIESTDEQGKRFVFWIGRKLHDGAYLVFPLDIADADGRDAEKYLRRRPGRGLPDLDA